MYDCIVVGGGIVGLSTAMAILERSPGARVVILEKESRWAAHQSGRNSGVIHSGIYYRPGSLKARYATEGSRAMVEFCRERGIRHEICGKLVVATSPVERPRLEELRRRGIANGIEVREVGREELRELEPNAEGVAALHVPQAGIVDYGQVADAFVAIIRERGGELRLNTRVHDLREDSTGVTVETDRGVLQGHFLVNCAGLYSDRIARLAGLDPGAQIVPFRGEYYELVPERRHLVRNLIYPVPNPEFPFLGVHFTRMIDGSVHAGPNAVLAFRREGYRKSDIDVRELQEVLIYRGFWKLAARHWKDGTKEVMRSISKAVFVRTLQTLVPEIRPVDLVAAPSGVRAQALGPDGKLIEDFHIVHARHSVHVCNAPSPAATASIPIGRFIAGRVQFPQLVTR